MGKYFSVVDGKAHDWKFTRSKARYDFLVWNFYLGETFVGQIFKGCHRRSGWDPVPHDTPCPLGGITGFATRHDAAVYMLKVCGYIPHPDEIRQKEMRDSGFVPVEIEKFIELIKAKEKLEAAEAELERLRSDESWRESPERMGQ